MDSRFMPTETEARVYDLWEKRGLLKPKSDKKPFTILMPPPNANASLHAGHGMYTVEDILIRYKRLMGFDALWVPGMDHAGFETQFVYEKHLRKEGKSRMDFDRETFYKNVAQFVLDNSGLIYKQFKRLGFLADWERSVFTLNDHVLKTVTATFAKMEREGLIYRNEYIVNYCNYCGTSFSELEALHIDRQDPLYYFRYGDLEFATVRPETVFADVALAVNPKDKRYQKYVGTKIKVEGLFWLKEIPVIADDYVDPKFATGVVKITPAHDPNDFQIGRRHNLPVVKTIDTYGRLVNAGPYTGMKVKAAREKFMEDIKNGVYPNFLVKIDATYEHAVTVCYKCKRDLEPTVIPNWFIRVEKLKTAAAKVVEENKVKFFPKKYKKQLLQWFATMRDWPISRQVVWGIRIPAWYDVQQNPHIKVVFLDKNKTSISGEIGELLKKYSFVEIEAALQNVTAPLNTPYVVSSKKPDKGNYLQETDTFDTWFSSGQWPLVTLSEEEYKTRFPTDVMGTLSEILPFWVSRMIMFSLYIRKEIPFKYVYLWSMVTDAKGQKMSKSKGNVVNPIELVDKYGADAFRGALLFGVAPGSRIPLSEDKVRAMRNFANKVWNMGRFIHLSAEPLTASDAENKGEAKQSTGKVLTILEEEVAVLEKKYKKLMNGFNFSQAFGELYEFLWHRFADYYIEALKDEIRNGNIEVRLKLSKVLLRCLLYLHPFMPFVTEALYQELAGHKGSILEQKV